MATSKKKSTTKSTVHKYVSTKPVNSYEDYKRKEYHWDTYNKGMPDAYKPETATASTYTNTYTPTEYTDAYTPEQYQSKYMPQIEQRLNDVANWKYDPLQDASYQALAAVYGARGNQAAKNSLADAAMLNGGYGTSNAVSAAQQARNQYNQELAALIPDLEQAAYNRAQTGLGALMDIDNSQYGRFSDDQSRQLQSKQFGLDVAGYNEGNRQFAANRDLDVFNTNEGNRQWAWNANQGERQFGYNSLWDRYNAQNANRQWVSSMNQNERQFDYNAGMDRAQLLNDYYKWATGENNALWEWNYAQEQKAKSGGSGGGRGRSGGGGGGGYVSTGTTGTGDVDTYTKGTELAEEKKKKTKGKVANKPYMYVNHHTKDFK